MLQANNYRNYNILMSSLRKLFLFGFVGLKKCNATDGPLDTSGSTTEEDGIVPPESVKPPNHPKTGPRTNQNDDVRFWIFIWNIFIVFII